MADTCPPPRALEAFAGGGDDTLSVREHVHACAVCREMVAEIRENQRFLRGAATALGGALAAGNQPGSSGEVGRRYSELVPGGVPGFELLEEIGRGGQGVVFRAVQLATKRPVALKMLLAGSFATARQVRRFEREIEFAASLRHPHIVSIFESGVTADGLRFVAMEYVRGQALDVYARTSRVENPGRRHVDRVVRLLSQVSEALAHAHANAVIHRDLKPSNVLVDSSGNPHVVDFGLARGIDPVDDASLTGEFAGTPLFAAPEQFSGNAEPIDTRTDVYALGVLLYVGLTGQCPHRGASIRELMRAILEDEVERPSRHNPAVDDELDTIVLKTLAKNKQRRYQSAEALRDDLERYQRGEALAAKRDSAVYMLRKTLRRYRAAVTVAAAFGLLVTAFAVKASLDAQRLANERDVAQAARLEATQQKNVSVAVKEFMQNIVSEADPNKRGRPDLTMRQVLDAAVGDVDAGRFSGQPEIEAEVRTTLAATLQPLGALDAAEQQCRKALALREALFGLEHASVGQSLGMLAGLRHAQGDSASALPLGDRALAIARRHFDEDSDRVQDCVRTLAFCRLHAGDRIGAASLARAALEVAERVHGWASISTTRHLECLAGVAHADGDYGACAELALEALALGENHEAKDSLDLANLLNNATASLTASGRFEDAIRYGRKALVIFEARLGPDHEDVAMVCHNLGIAYVKSGDLRRAAEYAQRTSDILLRLPGGDPRHLCESLNLSATLFVKNGEPIRAVGYMREALEIASAAFPAESEEYAGKLNNMAVVLTLAGDPDEAVELLGKALAIRRSRHPQEDHPAVAEALSNLGGALLAADQAAIAEPLLQAAGQMRLRLFGEQSVKAADTLVSWATALTILGQLDDAEDQLRAAKRLFEANAVMPVQVHSEMARCMTRRGRADQAVELLEPLLREDAVEANHHTLLAEFALAEALLDLGRIEDAERRLRYTYIRAVRGYGPQSFITRRVVNGLAEIFEAAGDAASAARWREAGGDPNGVR